MNYVGQVSHLLFSFYVPSLGVIGGLILENAPLQTSRKLRGPILEVNLSKRGPQTFLGVCISSEIAHLSHAKCLCVRHVCVLCFTQCGEAELSELSPTMTPVLGIPYLTLAKQL